MSPASIVPKAEETTLGRPVSVICIYVFVSLQKGALLGTGSTVGLGNLETARLDDVEVVGLSKLRRVRDSEKERDRRGTGPYLTGAAYLPLLEVALLNEGGSFGHLLLPHDLHHGPNPQLKARESSLQTCHG